LVGEFSAGEELTGNQGSVGWIVGLGYLTVAGNNLLFVVIDAVQLGHK
jgi:hypothetical protein